MKCFMQSPISRMVRTPDNTLRCSGKYSSLPYFWAATIDPHINYSGLDWIYKYYYNF